MKPPRIVVAGNLSLDDTVNPNGVLEAAPGGDALYAALAVRGWGAEAVLLTLVGEDYPSEHLERTRQVGVDVQHVRRVDGPTIHYRVTNADDGSREYAWISSPDRLLATSPSRDDYAGLVDFDWLHVAAMPIEAQENAVAAARTLATERTTRPRVSVDPHEEYVVGYEGRVRSMVRDTVFLPSELEARLLFPDLSDEHRDDSVAFGMAAARRLATWGPAAVAVKVGARGSVVSLAQRAWHVPALSVPVVDSTGAGDAYCGGFVVGMLLTGDARVAGACGTVSAAETISSFGAFTDAPIPAFMRLERLDWLLRQSAVDDADRSALLAEAEPIREFVGSGLGAPA